MLAWWVLLIVAALVGIVAWLWATNRERSKHAARLLELEAGYRALDGKVKELRSELEEKQQQIESTRARLQAESEAKAAAEARLQETQTTVQQQQKLLEQAKDIFTNLRTPNVKGRWGELTLHRVVELAGMSEQCDFEEQVIADAGEGRARPDMIVRLPAGRQVVIDAKAPLDAFQDAMQASSEEDRKAAMGRHAQLVRNHMNALSAKTYWAQFPQAPEFVVLFLPGESFFSGALECDRTLIEDGIARRVVLATPTTLIALLWAVANGWRWEAIAKNTEAISQLGAQLYERMTTLTSHLSNLGSALGKAVETYNQTVGSLESRLLPSVRRFKELGATAADDIPALQPIEQAPRSLPEE